MVAEHSHARSHGADRSANMFEAAEPSAVPTYEPSRPVDRSSIFVQSLRDLQAAPTVARCCSVFYGVAGYNDSQYGRSHHLFRSRRRSPQHEGSAGKLYAQPGGLHPNQWLDGGPVRNPSWIRVWDWSFHPRLFSV